MSKEPIITATQKKRELTDYQKEILEGMSNVKSCDIIISISKKRLEKGESAKIKVDYNGKRLIPLKQ